MRTRRSTLLVAVLQFIPATYLDRISSLTQISSGQAGIVTDESFRGRLSENLAAIQMFQDHPIFGVGLNNFQLEYQEYSRRIGLDPRRELRSPASLYLEILSEQGLFGIAIFGYLIFTVFRRLFLARNYFKRNNSIEIKEGKVGRQHIGKIGFSCGALYQVCQVTMFRRQRGKMFDLAILVDTDAEKQFRSCGIDSEFPVGDSFPYPAFYGVGETAGQRFAIGFPQPVGVFRLKIYAHQFTLRPETGGQQEQNG